MAPTVQGTPLPVGVQVIGDYDGELDPYPRIDVQTANVLQRARAFAIVQRPSLTEAACPSCERSNIYDIYDGNSGQHIFFAKERSECGWRFCCAPYHALFLDFKLSTGIPPQMYFMTDLDVLPTHMTMEREGCRCPGCRCPGCCTCSPEYCSDGMFLHAGPLRPGLDPGYLKGNGPNCVGFAQEPRFGGGFTPTLNIMERAAADSDAEAPAWNALAKIEGPACFGGCLELCCSSRFSVSSLSAQTLDVGLHRVGDLAEIVKRKPTDLLSYLRELATDADVYTLQFSPHAHLAPQQKATILASLLLADYMFFERDTPPCSRAGCNLCNVWCCGCVCPLSIVCCLNDRVQNEGASGGGGGGYSSGFVADQ